MPAHPTRHRLQRGRIIDPRALLTTKGEVITVPAQGKLVHLQFRRFAGCPVCSLHLQSIAQRHEEIAAAGLVEVVVFHSSADALRPFTDGLPFAVIPDPGKQLYVEFGVESGPGSLLDPRGWPAILRAIVRSVRAIRDPLASAKPATPVGARSATGPNSSRTRVPLPPLNPPGGRFGLPADFLIDRDGRIRDLKYGSHVYDQWSVDELLALAQSHRDDFKALRREAITP
jgi:peroxiredoxin